MIALLSGKIIEKHKDILMLMTAGGVGYEIRMSSLKLTGFSIDQTVTLYTYLKVSDSALDLYGFETSTEREFFTLLMTVSGIGPKTAMNILSLGSILQIQAAIARGDVKYLTAVSGLGKKTAERLVVELKGKIANQESGIRNQDSGVMEEVIDALVSMGYGREEAKDVVTRIESVGKSTEELLKAALRQIK